LSVFEAGQLLSNIGVVLLGPPAVVCGPLSVSRRLHPIGGSGSSSGGGGGAICSGTSQAFLRPPQNLRRGNWAAVPAPCSVPRLQLLITEVRGRVACRCRRVARVAAPVAGRGHVNPGLRDCSALSGSVVTHVPSRLGDAGIAGGK
jgi:hypothetical protein